MDRPSFDQSLFSWVKDYAELVYCNTRFVLFHYPMLEWNGYFDQSIHLHGHQHNYEMCIRDRLSTAPLLGTPVPQVY